jgi:hypothetical protein
MKKGMLILFPEVKILCNDKYIKLKSKIKKSLHCLRGDLPITGLPIVLKLRQ